MKNGTPGELPEGAGVRPHLNPSYLFESLDNRKYSLNYNTEIILPTVLPDQQS